MATKKRSTTPRRRVRAYAPSQRRSYRKKSGTTMIPSAAATIGMAVANKDVIMTVVNDMSLNGVKSAINKAIQPNQLKKTALYTGGAYVAGEAVKRYAPGIVKGPAGKIAKKIPKVF